jgi:hypothetical protein
VGRDDAVTRGGSVRAGFVVSVFFPSGVSIKNDARHSIERALTRPSGLRVLPSLIIG